MEERDLLIWIDEKDKIISMHRMKDCREVVFEERTALLEFLLQLCERSYRFQ